MSNHRRASIIVEPSEDRGARELEQLLATTRGDRQEPPTRTTIDGALVGTVVGFKDGKDRLATPLVTYRGQPGTAPISARATIELHGVHIGCEAMLLFEDGDPYRPVVVGCLRPADRSPLADLSDSVELDVDGEHLLVSAKQQIVLRCGKASITLTSAGKVLIQGEYISNRSSGLNRIRGGSIQLN